MGPSPTLVSSEFSWWPASNILGIKALLENQTQGSPELSLFWLKPFPSLPLLVYIAFNHTLLSYHKLVLSWVHCEGPECGIALIQIGPGTVIYPAEVSSLAVKLGFVPVPWIMTRNHLQWRRQMRWWSHSKCRLHLPSHPELCRTDVPSHITVVTASPLLMGSRCFFHASLIGHASPSQRHSPRRNRIGGISRMSTSGWDWNVYTWIM